MSDQSVECSSGSYENALKDVVSKPENVVEEEEEEVRLKNNEPSRCPQQVTETMSNNDSSVNDGNLDAEETSIEERGSRKRARLSPQEDDDDNDDDVNNEHGDSLPSTVSASETNVVAATSVTARSSSATTSSQEHEINTDTEKDVCFGEGSHVQSSASEAGKTHDLPAQVSRSKRPSSRDDVNVTNDSPPQHQHQHQQQQQQRADTLRKASVVSGTVLADRSKHDPDDSDVNDGHNGGDNGDMEVEVMSPASVARQMASLAPETFASSSSLNHYHYQCTQDQLPPHASRTTNNEDNKNYDNVAGDDDDDVPIIEATNLTNPYVSYPHLRFHCGIHPFSTQGGETSTASSSSPQSPRPQSHTDNFTTNPNLTYCTKCYCYVCDIPAADCPRWKFHCNATNENHMWVTLRQRKKNGLLQSQHHWNTNSLSNHQQQQQQQVREGDNEVITIDDDDSDDDDTSEASFSSSYTTNTPRRSMSPMLMNPYTRNCKDRRRKKVLCTMVANGVGASSGNNNYRTGGGANTNLTAATTTTDSIHGGASLEKMECKDYIHDDVQQYYKSWMADQDDDNDNDDDDGDAKLIGNNKSNDNEDDDLFDPEYDDLMNYADMESTKSMNGGGGGKYVKSQREMRITEVLVANLRRMVNSSAAELSLQRQQQQQQHSSSSFSPRQPSSLSSASSSLEEFSSSLFLLLSESARTNSFKNDINDGTGGDNNHVDKDSWTRKKMEGDIPQLVLQKSFFVEGVRIGWPFPSVMQPQRQMAIHLIKALKRKLHVILESPTGTGKSAAILCSVLAWQRYHAKTHCEDSNSKAVPKIIYCSRTHSQVTQMVQSLRKTPYRPRMSILASRERLCIHRNIRPRGETDESSPAVNVNNECRIRVGNTEKYRKSKLQSLYSDYDDNSPPDTLPGDNDDPGSTGTSGASQSNNAEASSTGDDAGDAFSTKTFFTCPHYRQLTTLRTASLAHSVFRPNEKLVNCCSRGGDKSKMGTHDIEDLVAFGLNPNVRRGVAIYRDPNAENPSFGLTLGNDEKNRCCVNAVKDGGAAAAEGTILKGDRIVRVNREDVRDCSLQQVAETVKETKNDPLLLDVFRGVDGDEEDYSSVSPCPYYVTRALSADAEIIFAPYNYVLDPKIRKSLDIDLEGSVVILDEAHNIEDTLRESGSGNFGEFELCDLVVMLSAYSIMSRSRDTRLQIPGGDKDICDVAHDLLLFVEKLLEFLQNSRNMFENNAVKKGAASAIREYEQFHLPDDKQFEVTYDGPTGYGLNGKAIGCLPFFEKLAMTEKDFAILTQNVNALENHIKGRVNDSWEQNRSANLIDRLLEMVEKLTFAVSTPEHYFISSVVRANGSLEFASTGDENNTNRSRYRAGARFRRKPRKLPFIAPRTEKHPERLPHPCLHTSCREAGVSRGLGNAVRHGSFCDGSTPRWEASLVLNLLSPAVHMKDLSDHCRTVVLASGSLSPIKSLCGELNLLPPKQPGNENDEVVDNEERCGRLQIHPQPLEANHVINHQKQLLSLSIGHFPDGSPLTVSYSNYSQEGFISKLGDAIATVVEAIPRGGVLIFLPSYSFLRKCIDAWNPDFRGRNRFSQLWSQDDGPSTWDRLIGSKSAVVVEPTGSHDKFEAAKKEYTDTIRKNGSCILVAVFRGKMSEGISFNDDNARGVICVGIPFPNAFDRSITAKKAYNDEQRRLNNRKELLTGSEWYRQQAYRATAQALGRCIRHAADYGTIILLDSRYCDEGAYFGGICHARESLPKWLKEHIRNLLPAPSKKFESMHMYAAESGTSVISGGWPGLKVEMKRFFKEAPIQCAAVLQKQEADFRKAQDRYKQSGGHCFNQKTGVWTVTSKSNACSTGKTSRDESADSTTSVCPNSIGPKDVGKGDAEGGDAIVLRQPPDAMPLQDSCCVKTDQTGLESLAAEPICSDISAAKSTNTSRDIFDGQRIRNDRSHNSEANKDEESKSVKPESKQKNAPSNEAFSPVSCSQDSVKLQQRTGKSEEFVEDDPADIEKSPTVPCAMPHEVDGRSNCAQTSENYSSAPTILPNDVLNAAHTFSGSNQIEYNKNLCVVCDEREKRVLLLPCRHVCLCKECSTLEKMVTCPMCRAMIENSFEVYL